MPKIEASDLRGSTGNPGLVNELLELAVSGNLEVITSGVADAGPRKVVVREVALEDLTILRSDQLSRSGRQLVGLLRHGALSVHRGRSESTCRVETTEVSSTFLAAKDSWSLRRVFRWRCLQTEADSIFSAAVVEKDS